MSDLIPSHNPNQPQTQPKEDEKKPKSRLKKGAQRLRKRNADLSSVHFAIRNFFV